MQTSQLTIGDLMQHANGKYFRITRLDMWSDGSIHFACGHPHLWDYNNKFTPIPLTPEILKKNGFGYVENDTYPYTGEVLSHFYLGEEGYCANMDIHIGTDNKGGFWFNSPKISLNSFHYVHELQHVLRLCNINKEIEL